MICDLIRHFMKFRVHGSVRDVSPIYAHTLPSSQWISRKYLPLVKHTFEMFCKIYKCDESMIFSVTATPTPLYLLTVTLPSSLYFFCTLPFLHIIPFPFPFPSHLFNRVHMAVTVAGYPGSLRGRKKNSKSKVKNIKIKIGIDLLSRNITKEKGKAKEGVQGEGERKGLKNLSSVSNAQVSMFSLTYCILSYNLCNRFFFILPNMIHFFITFYLSYAFKSDFATQQ